MTRVLPLPAPARMSTGPSVVSTASRCCGLSWERKDKASRVLIEFYRTSSLRQWQHPSGANAWFVQHRAPLPMPSVPERPLAAGLCALDPVPPILPGKGVGLPAYSFARAVLVEGREFSCSQSHQPTIHCMSRLAAVRFHRPKLEAWDLWLRDYSRTELRHRPERTQTTNWLLDKARLPTGVPRLRLGTRDPKQGWQF